MRNVMSLFGLASVAVLGVVVIGASMLAAPSIAQQESRPAFVLVERLETTASESVQQEYARLARDILPKYGARYLARSQHNALLEGDGAAPCCIAILQFPSLDAATRWYESPENQAAAKIRQSGGKFRLVAIEGLPDQR
jgi:uncharacterized protein (DUF1330 family)